MSHYGYIYLHRNLSNGNCYVGQSTQEPKRRFRKPSIEPYRESPAFYNALEKYGWIGFETTILVYVSNQETLNKLEEFYIKEYKSLNTQNGYNVREASEGQGKHAESTKEKISQKQLVHRQKLRDEGIITVAHNRKHHRIINGIEEKHCKRCERFNKNPWHPLSNFNQNDPLWDGLHRYCSTCQKEERKGQYLKHEGGLSQDEWDQSYVDRTTAMSEGAKRAHRENPNLAKISSEKNSKAIKRTDPNTGEIKIYKNGLEAKADGFDNTYVSQVCKGTYRSGTTFKGYKWEFVKKD